MRRRRSRVAPRWRRLVNLLPVVVRAAAALPTAAASTPGGRPPCRRRQWRRHMRTGGWMAGWPRPSAARPLGRCPRAASGRRRPTRPRARCSYRHQYFSAPLTTGSVRTLAAAWCFSDVRSLSFSRTAGRVLLSVGSAGRRRAVWRLVRACSRAGPCPPPSCVGMCWWWWWFASVT